MQFPETGLVRIDQAFARDDAAMMSELMWQTFERDFGIRKDDSETWSRVFRKRPLDVISAGPLFRAIFTERFAATVDGVFGEDALWDWPDYAGDFLITFPNAKSWAVPHDGWHRDWERAPGNPTPACAVKTFVFLNDVGAGGGGTVVVQGSHLLEEPHEVPGENQKIERVMYAHPWLRALRTAGDAKARYRQFVEQGTEIDRVELKVVELTGKAGDVVVLHPWLLHAVAPNAAATPRFMRTPVISFEAETHR